MVQIDQLRDPVGKRHKPFFGSFQNMLGAGRELQRRIYLQGLVTGVAGFSPPPENEAHHRTSENGKEEAKRDAQDLLEVVIVEAKL